MKTNSCSKRFGLSLVAALLLGSGAYAGKIIGVTAGTTWDDPSQQYGFHGWNLENVVVNITTDSSFSDVIYLDIWPDYNLTTTTADYPDMNGSMSFESKIYTGGEIRGLLHGKDWPVGEPSGIKVVNDDFEAYNKSGKSPNCIMTTSYLDANATGNDEPSGYLDVYPGGTPVPTVCSSPFQTHKRFKINMQPTTVAGVVAGTEAVYGKPIDLVFNLDVADTDPIARSYQVFSKINNYTGMRLDGYKVELLDENGTEVNASHAIKFSLDLVTDPTKTSEDESGYEAVFSNGLWGPKDTNLNHVPLHFEEDGFFDNVRAGFFQDGNDSQMLTGGPATLKSNYEALFGIWLPSKWAPYGIFWDDDNDTTTDAELVAFWGDPLDTGTNAWHSGQDYNLTDGDQSWAEPTEALEKLAANDPLYSIGVIEDTLNLGLNYVVEVGLNSTIGKTFTIRITPRVAPLAAQTPPSYIDAAGNYILPPQLVPDVPVVPVVPPTGTTDDGTTDVPLPTSSSDGGSCTFNPNSKGIDTTVLLMLAMGLLYPFRRRFIK